MGKILYILGVIAAIWCVLDIWKKNIETVKKILLTILVLCCSWVGLILYYFFIKDRL